jgi:hypothetical protein
MCISGGASEPGVLSIYREAMTINSIVATNPSDDPLAKKTKEMLLKAKHA